VRAVTTPPAIAILVHESDPHPRPTPHSLWRIAEVWREWGCAVHVLRGTRAAAPAVDLVVPQIDLTTTPTPYRRYLERFPRVLNRRVVDISKRRVSGNLLRRGDSWDGPVIVKTDRNYGGLPEAKRAPWWSPGQLASRIQQRRHSTARGDFRFVREIPTGEYPIFPNARSVPPSVWSNRYLVVERFVPEIVDGLFCLRACLCLGDVVLNRRLLSPRPVIKGSAERSEEMPVLPALLEFRERFGLDYGKIDYVVHDGELCVLDVNRSPGVLADAEVTDRICRKLAAGVRVWIDSLPPAGSGPAP
jgi:hypothetical protein